MPAKSVRTRACIGVIVITVCVSALAAAGCWPTTMRAAGPLGAPRRVPSREAPLRIDLVGDSMAHALAAGFSPALRAAGPVKVIDHGWWGFGFTSGWTALRDGKVFVPASTAFGEWPEHYAEIVAHDDPDAFVAYVGGWDVVAPRLVDGRLLTPGTTAWRTFYAGVLDRAARILTAKGALLYVFGPPCDGEGPTEKGYNQGNGLVRQMFSALARRHPGTVVYLDLNPLLCPTGRPSAYATTESGTRIKVFGAHFTPDGGRLVGEWFVGQVAQTWGLRRPK